jgi:hypothetical protein
MSPTSAITGNPLALIGTRYVRGGVTPADGFDCFTLIRYVRATFFERDTPTVGVPAAILSSAQAAAFLIHRTLNHGKRATPWWVACEPAPGVAVALGEFKLSRLHHCGVVCEDGVLHALEGCGVLWTPFSRLQTHYARVEFFECQP